MQCKNSRHQPACQHTFYTAIASKLFLMKQNNVRGSASAVASSSFKARLKRYRWAIAWCLLQVCALILSYNEVPYFNNTGEPVTEKFWPFVKFTYPYFRTDDHRTYSKFNGIFTEYDWTEFSFYTGVVLFVILLVHVNKKSK